MRAAAIGYTPTVSSIVLGQVQLPKNTSPGCAFTVSPLLLPSVTQVGSSHLGRMAPGLLCRLAWGWLPLSFKRKRTEVAVSTEESGDCIWHLILASPKELDDLAILAPFLHSCKSLDLGSGCAFYMGHALKPNGPGLQSASCIYFLAGPKDI